MDQLSEILLNDFIGIVIIVFVAAKIGEIMGKFGFKPLTTFDLFPLFGFLVSLLVFAASFQPFIYHFMSNQGIYTESGKIISLVVGGVGWFLMGTSFGKPR